MDYLTVLLACLSLPAHALLEEIQTAERPTEVISTYSNSSVEDVTTQSNFPKETQTAERPTEVISTHSNSSVEDVTTQSNFPKEIQTSERRTEVISTHSNSSVEDVTTQSNLPKGNSSSISVYVLSAAGCVIVVTIVFVVVVMLCRRRLGNDEQEHIYYEIDEIQSQENNRHVNDIYTVQLPHTLESCREYSEGQRVSANQYDYVSNHGSSIYLTPVYSTEHDYSSIYLHSQSIPGNTDGRYEELRNNNICENEYELLHTSSKSKE